MKINDLIFETTKANNGFVIAQIRDDELKFFSVRRTCLVSAEITIHDTIEDAIIFDSEEIAMKNIEYYKEESKIDDYYFIKGDLDFDKLFVMKVEVNTKVEYKLSEMFINGRM